MKLLTVLASSSKNSNEIQWCSPAWTRVNIHFWLIQYCTDLILMTVKQLQTYSSPTFQNSVPWSETDSVIDYCKHKWSKRKRIIKAHVYCSRSMPDVYLKFWLTTQWKEWEDYLSQHFSRKMLQCSNSIIGKMPNNNYLLEYYNVIFWFCELIIFKEMLRFLWCSIFLESCKQDIRKFDLCPILSI